MAFALHFVRQKPCNNNEGCDVIGKPKDTQSRKWQITINNPLDKGLTHDMIKEKISEMKSISYYCMADEVGGKTQTHHTHLYIYSSSAIRFSTIKRRFEAAHIELAKGTSQQNRDYVFKEGKWLDNKEKGNTKLPDTQEEWGEMPIERQGARNDLADLYDSIKSGLSTYEILEEYPDFLTKTDYIEKTRQIIINEEFKNKFRKLSVTYIFGQTGTGKSRGVLERYGYENVFRVTNYMFGGFDGYKGQDVIIFEEFSSSFKIQDMLNYLDGYPLELPCRYANKIACYTKVYIISNISLIQQYESVQMNYPEIWNAFIRRIHKVVYYAAIDNFIEYETKEFLDLCSNETEGVIYDGT